MTQEKKYSAAAATVGALAVFALAAPAFASGSWGGCGSGCGWGGWGRGNTDNSIDIDVDNSGTINNTVSAYANTGNNWAGGSVAGNGGDSGDVDADLEGSGLGGGEFGDVFSGDGGDGGSTGDGGTVITGDATADAGAYNVMNSTDVTVEDECGCEEDSDLPPWLRHRGREDNSIDVDVDNDGTINNTTKAKAFTGGNSAGGSVAGNGGDSGEVDADVEFGRRSSRWSWWHHNQGNFDGWEFGDVFSGDGGNGGDTGDGGLVQTGDSESNAGAINILNTSLIRVLRGR